MKRRNALAAPKPTGLRIARQIIKDRGYVVIGRWPIYPPCSPGYLLNNLGGMPLHNHKIRVLCETTRADWNIQIVALTGHSTHYKIDPGERFYRCDLVACGRKRK